MVDLAKVDPRGDLIRTIRGNEIAMIFQEPMTSLIPVHTIGNQIMEAVDCTSTSSKDEAQQPRDRGAAPGGHRHTRNSASTSIRTSFRAACASGR